jgi:6-phospho-beta-glucosidase
VRVAILGGGGFRVPLIFGALQRSRLAVDEIVLHDPDPGRLAVIAAVLRDPRVRTTGDLDAAVTGTDVVFSAIRPGGVDGRVADERTALDLGVLGQETVGAGGLAYAFRCVPVVRQHAETIAERAPGAWVISMTNPAGLVTEVMAATLGPRVIGVCDSPSGLVRRAADALGLDAADAEAAEVDYLGINHLGWLRGLRVGGVDRLPELLADPARLATTEEGRLFGADVVAALGALPNEYLYWYYAAREAHAGVQAAGRTRAEHVRTQQAAFYAAATAEPGRAPELWRAANDERNRSYFAELRDDERDDADVAAGGYETVAIALTEALFGGPPAELIVNVAHHGAVAGLPEDLVLELPCTVDGTGAHPRPVAPANLHEAGLMSLVRGCERDIARAALTGSRSAALAAFSRHPLVGSSAAARALTAALPWPQG